MQRDRGRSEIAGLTVIVAVAVLGPSFAVIVEVRAAATSGVVTVNETAV